MSKPQAVGGGIIAGAVLVIAIIICGAFLGYRGQEPANPGPSVEISDCDADDKIGKWDVEDCGPSPLPMQTANQRRTPAPRASGKRA